MERRYTCKNTKRAKMLKTNVVSTASKGKAGSSVAVKNPDTRMTACTVGQDLHKNKEELGNDLRAKVKDGPTQKQIKKSEKHVVKLQKDGTELVTNLLVEADASELSRRNELQEANRLRLQKLEHDSKFSTETFTEIIENWTDAESKRVHQELRENLKKQQELCQQIIDDKNNLIMELKHELKSRNDHFVKDRKREVKEVHQLIERMQDQISSLKKDYRKELDLIESSFSGEWRDLLTESMNQWEMQRRNQLDKELQFLRQRLKMLQEHENLLDCLRAECTKEYNNLKIKQETDLQHIEKTLQDRKTIYQVNEGKIKCKEQILKKREKEETISKAQQIRKIIKLQDTYKNLKKKNAIQEEQSRDEIQLLTGKCKQLTQQYKDIQNKTKHFAAVDGKRYGDIWLMNEDEAKVLVCKAVDLDRAIHEQVLALTYSPRPLHFMDYSDSEKVLEEQDEPQDQTDQGGSSTLADSDSLENNMAELAELLCDAMDFLIEKDFSEAFLSTRKENQNFLRVYSIFSALGLKKEEDVNKMIKFLQKYKESQTEEEFNIIHPNDLLKALRDFTAQNCKPREIVRHKKSVLVNNSEDKVYWENVANIIPESGLKVWRALREGLEKYHARLTKRSKLLAETQRLKNQNAELRMLLHMYQRPRS